MTSDPHPAINPIATVRPPSAQAIIRIEDGPIPPTKSEQQGSTDNRQSHAKFIAPVQPICGLGYQQCSLRSGLYYKSCTVPGPLQPISTKSPVEADPSTVAVSAYRIGNEKRRRVRD